MVGVGLTVIAFVRIQPVDPVYVIVAVPAEIPVTTPVVLPTVATPGALLVHVPPGVASVNVIVEPTHTADGPAITAGNAFTVITLVVEQPPPNEYVIVTIPGFTPVTIPVKDPTVAIVSELLLHVPPLMISLSVIVDPTHTLDGPVIGAGEELTVTVNEPGAPAQPEGSV